MKTYILAPILLATVLLTGGCLKKNPLVTNDQTFVNQNQEENMENIEEDGLMATQYDMAEIAQHNNADDCWLLISGKVYDVTSFIAGGNHGGGDAILEGCGIDATELYETRPMGSGTPHSDKARGFLEGFYIGDFRE
ncbi:hypothetical protein KKH39_02025 [Patescibacteria group bacterium]|nr:hypothetical protein [Patescibacteria group bacterium]